MTWPTPRVKTNGSFRGMLLSNSVPSSSVPCKHFNAKMDVIVLFIANRIMHAESVPLFGLHIARFGSFLYTNL